MPEAVRYLVITGAHIPEALASRVQYVMLRGRIRVSEIPNNPDGAFSLRVEALDAEGTSRFFLGPDEWEPAGRNRFAPASESAAWIPDFTDVAPLREAIFTAGFSWHRGKGSWIVAGSPGNPDRLAAWLASLPADIIREADEASKGLIEPPGRMRLSLDLRSAGQDWFDLGVTLRPDDTSLSKDEIALLLRADGRMVRLPDRGWQRLHFQMSPRDESTLAGLGLDTSAMEGTRQRFHALQLAQAPLEGLADAKQLDEIRQRADAIRSVSTPELPEDLQATLRPYQLEGFHFLAFLAANGFGGVLADDMGLGKTVQTLTWLLYLRSRKSKKLPFQVLVVCPKSVVTNWTIETAKFAPSLKSVSYSSKAATATALKKANLVIANYAQLRLGAEYFQSIEWDAVILDEGQNIKNPQSQSAQVARSLNALHRVVLTGTPVENRMMDLWSLFAFAMPGLLGTQTAFKRAFPDTGGPEVRQRLAARVRNFMLRRTKGQVAADLPARVEEDLYVELDGEQRTLYDAELKRARQQLLGIKTDKQLDKARFNILTSLLRLRQICCHPGLLDDEFKAAPSAKLDALIDQIEPVVAEGHKVLVFSQFVGMLEKISERLKESAVPHLMLTGQTENRQELVDRFQNDPAEPVFLLSLRAAGSGLNLTAASYVVLFDPWWNPAVEAQAIDRTHRIGQVNRVMAYRLLVKDTIEEKIRALQRDKAKLAGDIVQEESLATVLDLENLRYLLS
jgi:SNF2 family DNA or RNA helicase